MKRIREFIGSIVDAAADEIAPTCDVPGCDEDPEPVFLDGWVVFLCFDHTVEYLIANECESPEERCP